MAGLCTPLPTLRCRPRGRCRTARGQCGSLLLHRNGLAPSTPCRSPGALRSNNLPHHRAVQRSSDSLVGEDKIEVEGAIPEGFCDVRYAIVADDVESEAAGSGHNARVVADAAAILVAGDVADIVVAVFDAPMPTNDVGPCAGGQSGGR